MITVQTDWLLRGTTCTKSGGHEALSGTVGWAVMKKICVLIKDRQQFVGRFWKMEKKHQMKGNVSLYVSI